MYIAGLPALAQNDPDLGGMTLTPDREEVAAERPLGLVLTSGQPGFVSPDRHAEHAIGAGCRPAPSRWRAVLMD
jgi:hypothetical protein